MKLTYIDESNFEETVVEFNDFQYELAKKILDLVNEHYKTSPGVILPSKDGKKLVIGARDSDESISLVMRECGVGTYKITIEPLVISNPPEKNTFEVKQID